MGNQGQEEIISMQTVLQLQACKGALIVCHNEFAFSFFVFMNSLFSNEKGLQESDFSRQKFGFS